MLEDGGGGAQQIKPPSFEILNIVKKYFSNKTLEYLGMSQECFTQKSEISFFNFIFLSGFEAPSFFDGSSTRRK